MSATPNMLALAMIALTAGCCPPRPLAARAVEGGSAQPTALDPNIWRAVSSANDGYHSRREIHRVTVAHPDKGGVWRERKMRGLLVIQRPDRFRLAVLSPMGLRIFDILGDRQGIHIIRQGAPNQSASGDLQALARSIGGDIREIYRLGHRLPPSMQASSPAWGNILRLIWTDAGGSELRSLRARGDSMAVITASDAHRRIRYKDRRRQKGIWIAHRILVDNQQGNRRARYRLTIDVAAVELDPRLNPRLFEVR